MLDWIDFGPQLWVLTAIVRTLFASVAFLGLLAGFLVLLQYLWKYAEGKIFEANAERITADEIDEDGFFTGPDDLLYITDRQGLIVEAGLRRVTVDNNMWVDGCLDVKPGTHLHVVGTLFYSSFGPRGQSNITAADIRSNSGWLSYEETDDAWEECGGLNGPGTVKSKRRGSSE